MHHTLTTEATPLADPRLVEAIQQLAPFVGHTRLFPLPCFGLSPNVKMYAKLEWQQFGGSVKSRPAFEIIRQAVLSGKLQKDMQLVDASSGNTGIAYATVCAALGIGVRLYIPENASRERKQQLKALGVDIQYTSAMGGTDEGQGIAREVCQNQPERFYYADQYGNQANWQAHQKSTAAEIWQQTEGAISHFVAGIGTTGTFVGTSRGLRQSKSDVQCIALQPDHGMHALEGWKHLETTQRIPAIWDGDLVDCYMEVSTEESFEWVKRAAAETGLLISPSSAANLAGMVKVGQQLEEGVLVTVFPDNIEKYGELMEQLF